ncbi:MAG: PDZ domain-containing protein [Deltaproteobacteria bacterium]|nr:PDZ domain-containing protein [Deltaproteobacteria bacterium]
MLRSLLGLALLTGLLAACPGTQVRWKAAEPLETLEPKVVVIYPFRFRWAEPEWRTHQKSRDLVSAALAEGRFLVVGPEELTVYRPDDPNVLAGSTLLPRLMELGLTPGEAVVLRAWAEERREKNTRLIFDQAGRPVARQQGEKRVVIAHLQLVEVEKGRILLEGHRSIPFDPLAIQPDYDPLHPLTLALRQMATEALERLEGKGHPSPGTKLVLQHNPAAAAPSGGADPLQTELLQLGFFAYFQPDWGPSDLKALERAGRGARVAALDGPATEAGLMVGDIITACNDMTVTGPETVLRHLARAETGVRLEVRRNLRTVQLVLPRRADD